MFCRSAYAAIDTDFYFTLSILNVKNCKTKCTSRSPLRAFNFTTHNVIRSEIFDLQNS